MKSGPSHKTRRRVLLSIWRQQQIQKQRPDFVPAPGRRRDRHPKAGPLSANWPANL